MNLQVMMNWEGVLNVSSVYIIFNTLQKSVLTNIADVVCVSVLVSAPALLPPLSLMLESVLHAEQQLTDRTKAKLLSALILALQIQGLNGQSACLFGETHSTNCVHFVLNIYWFRRRDYPASPAAVVCV